MGDYIHVLQIGESQPHTQTQPFQSYTLVIHESYNNHSVGAQASAQSASTCHGGCYLPPF
jgi:hypothetical protein